LNRFKRVSAFKSFKYTTFASTLGLAFFIKLNSLSKLSTASSFLDAGLVLELRIGAPFGTIYSFQLPG
jgi:hypothetical protein